MGRLPTCQVDAKWAFAEEQRSGTACLVIFVRRAGKSSSGSWPCPALGFTNEYVINCSFPFCSAHFDEPAILVLAP